MYSAACLIGPLVFKSTEYKSNVGRYKIYNHTSFEEKSFMQLPLDQLVYIQTDEGRCSKYRMGIYATTVTLDTWTILEHDIRVVNSREELSVHSETYKIHKEETICLFTNSSVSFGEIL